jgi:hypothetical protein
MKKIIIYIIKNIIANIKNNMCITKQIKINPLKLTLCVMLFMTFTRADENIYGDETFMDDTETNPKYNHILDLIFDREITYTNKKEITASDFVTPMITWSHCRETIKSRVIFPELFDPTLSNSTNYCDKEYSDKLKEELDMSRFVTKYVLDDIINNGNESNYIDKFNNMSKILNNMEMKCLKNIKKIVKRKELCMCYATNSTTTHCKEIIEFDQMGKTVDFAMLIAFGLFIFYYIM